MIVIKCLHDTTSRVYVALENPVQTYHDYLALRHMKDWM